MFGGFAALPSKGALADCMPTEVSYGCTEACTVVELKCKVLP